MKPLTTSNSPCSRGNRYRNNRDWFDSYIPNQTQYFSPDATAQLEQWGQRDSHQAAAGTYARKIYNRLLIDLSFNSSRLEGNTYSLFDTERLLLEGTARDGKLDEEKVMLLNHKEAIRYLVDNAHRLDINFNELCTLHYLLADGLVPPQYAGKVRDHGVRIGSSTYVPVESQQQLNKQLYDIAVKAAQINNPYEQSLFILVHIGYLQAFTDVNKRTSRIAANIPLIKQNLVPLSFNLVEKEDYASALIAIYEINATSALADLYMRSYEYSCRQYDATVESLGFDEVRVRYRKQRREVIRELIIKKITQGQIDSFVQAAANKLPAEVRTEFIEDIREDLREISTQTIVGLGVSGAQLQEWLSLQPTD